MSDRLEDALRDIQQGIKTEIYLNWTADIRYEEAKRLAETLKYNNTVTKIEICGISIGDKEAREMAQAIKINTTLQKIDLSENNIGYEGGREIALAIKVNSTLREIGLMKKQYWR